MLNFNEDVKQYENLFVAEYEKANIWPNYRDIGEGNEILEEEIEEASEKVKELGTYFGSLGNIGKVELMNIKAHSIGAICELLQVIAVCNKYDQLLIKTDKS